MPIPRSEKGPRIKGWQNLRIGDADLPAYFAHNENVGVLLGEPSGGLLDIDLDSPEVIALSKDFLAATECIHGRASKPASHWWYIVNPPPRPERFADVDGACLTEIRSTGQQTLVPPSLHPSGEKIEWTQDGEPRKIDPAALRAVVARMAAAALLARHWPAPGSRHNAALALAGMLLRSEWTEDQAGQFIAAVARAAGDEEGRQRARDVVPTAKRLHEGRMATGSPRLAQIVGEEVVRHISEWLALRSFRAPAVDVSSLGKEIRKVALATDFALFDKRRLIARLVHDALCEAGRFFRTADGRGFFFHNDERRLYDVELAHFRRLLISISGLSSTENFFKFALDLLQAKTLRESPLVQVHTLAHFDPESGLVAVSDSGQGIWLREHGGDWQELRNGDGGLLFLRDDEATPWVPEFEDGGSYRWWLNQFLFSGDGLSRDDAQTLLHLWVLQQFFPRLRRTRIIPCFLGPQGSGKTTAVRLVGRLFVGPNFDVTGVHRDREDAFVAAATNRLVLGLDNADSRVPWLPDALATYATGQRYRLRKLYTTNEEASYDPRAILLVDSRDPRFNRPDVAERLLLMYVSRPMTYRGEEEIFVELENHRGGIMGTLLQHVGEAADVLFRSVPVALPFRMADFGSFGARILSAYGKLDDYRAVLARLEKAQAGFACEQDGLVEALRTLLERGPVEELTIAELHKQCSEVAREHGLWVTRSVQGFGRHFTNMRRVIELELAVQVVEGRKHERTRIIALLPTKAEDRRDGSRNGSA